VQRVKFLDHIFYESGFSIDNSKFSIIENYPVPKSAKEVKRWLGLCGFYRRFLHKLFHYHPPVETITERGHTFCFDARMSRGFRKGETAIIVTASLDVTAFRTPLF
jgi:hypothetical protein